MIDIDDAEIESSKVSISINNQYKLQYVQNNMYFFISSEF